jgi:hypothetical protein
MQAQMTVKQFVLSHLGGTALAISILVSSVTAVATLSLTGDLPGIGDNGSAHVDDSSATTSDNVSDAVQRQLTMERDDYTAWRRSQAAITPAQRELRMERADFYAWQRSQKALPGESIAKVVTEADAARRQLEMDRDDYYEYMRLH